MNMTDLLCKLIDIESVNDGVNGNENEVQQFYYRFLRENNIDAELFYPLDVPGFAEHPGRLKEHNIENRPVVVAELSGNRPGKTLLLLAHSDTVPAGDLSKWSNPPFQSVVKDGRIYGRGAGDDKWGLVVMANLLIELKNSGCDFPGKVIIASVCDEESGGGNGTISLFAKGITADEAIYLDGGSNMNIWNCGLGGGYCRVRGEDEEFIRRELLAIKADIKAKIDAHKDFGKEFFSIIANQFFSLYPKADGTIGAFLDTLPGDDENELRASVEARLPGCSITWMSRFLKAAPAEPNRDLTRRLSEACRAVTGSPAPLIGGVQSDQGLVMHFGAMPCVDFGCGRRGCEGASHLPDEFITIENLEKTYQIIKRFVTDGR